ncbi:MAG TPA: PIN domain-containing protein [Candidatus Ozemobacteraceae bacterium]|nr:PIN domain-containing protein [Candidatus Ozemobacteraceae bacterium]
MIKAYIDCNILLDWLLDREPFSSYSAKIIELTETRKILGLVSPLTLANTYYIIAKELNKKIADEFIIDSLRIFSVPGISLKNVKEAVSGRFKDFEDDVHSSVAAENNVDFLITRNKRDFKNDKFKVLDAEEFLRIIEKK